MNIRLFMAILCFVAISSLAGTNEVASVSQLHKDLKAWFTANPIREAVFMEYIAEPYLEMQIMNETVPLVGLIIARGEEPTSVNRQELLKQVYQLKAKCSRATRDVLMMPNLDRDEQMIILALLNEMVKQCNQHGGTLTPQKKLEKRR